MSFKESMALYRDALADIRADHGLLRAIAASPLVFLLMAFLGGTLSQPPDDTEKIEAAKERSAQIDDWSELVSK